MRWLIQVSPDDSSPESPLWAMRGAAQAASTCEKAALQVTRSLPRLSVRASECEQRNPSSGRMPRRLGSTQKMSGSSRRSAMGKIPLR
jgi:hypothetical protein